MTVLEFESWVSDNYERLVDTAVRVTSNHPDATDMLHALVEELIEHPERLPKTLRKDLVAWMGQALHRDALDRARQDAMKRRRGEELSASITALGPEDTFSDHTRSKHAAEQRRHRAKKAASTAVTAPIATELEALHWDGPMPGTTRWRFQTLRDDRLFIKRAIASQAESIWAAVKRQAHGLERGHSYTEFGLEASK